MLKMATNQFTVECSSVWIGIDQFGMITPGLVGAMMPQ